MWFYLLDCSALEMEKKVAGLFLSLSRLLFAAGLTLAPQPGVTAIHRLSLCSDRRGRERERVRQREKERASELRGGAEGGGSARPRLPGGRRVPLHRRARRPAPGKGEHRGPPSG